jgi:two-component system sensor kinase FixL
MEKAAAQAVRAASIISALRDFVEKRDTARSHQNLPDLIREAVSLAMLGKKHSDVKVHMALDAATPPLMLNKVQIQQVVVNLVRNALEAMADAKKPELTIASVADGADTIITVRDNGPGFSPEIAGQLFQPFVTTKKSGMGIGLTVCQSIIEAHGGTIQAADAAPGAVFAIRLPASA